ncbi:STM4015 family protein [Myxococcota bacterium]|nr:STM4015 family protein [Myxococcota bacterium]
MPRYELSEGTSHKFWDITLEGTTLKISYGRIGTAGQSTTKDLGSEAAAKKEYDKLVAEKTKKGYVLAAAADAADAGDVRRPLVGLEREVSNYEHPDKIVHRRITNFDPETGLKDAARGVAYRIHVDYDDADGFAEKWAAMMEDERFGKLQAIVIGSWDSEMGSGTDSAEVMTALVAAKDVLPELRLLFLGDVVQEECEMSWIEQADFAPVVNVYPKLEHLRVRGPRVMGVLKAPALRSLALETGGLDRGVVQSLVASELPELEYLELWLGTDDYGANVTVEDLAPLFSGSLFPKLRYLGIRDAELADDVAKALASAPIVERIEILDLSLGCLGDDGALALAASPAVKKLRRLDVHHHYMTDAGVAALKGLGIELDVSDKKTPDDWGDELHRYVAVGE